MADPFNWMTGAGSIISAGTDLLNFGLQAKQNRENRKLIREGWERDDNAVQRRKADLIAAGMNPLLAAGSAAGNQSPAMQTAPQIDDVGAKWIANQAARGQITKQDEEIKLLENENSGKAIDNQIKRNMLDVSNHDKKITLGREFKSDDPWQMQMLGEFFRQLGNFGFPNISDTPGDSGRSIGQRIMFDPWNIVSGDNPAVGRLWSWITGRGKAAGQAAADFGSTLKNNADAREAERRESRDRIQEEWNARKEEIWSWENQHR